MLGCQQCWLVPPRTHAAATVLLLLHTGSTCVMLLLSSRFDVDVCWCRSVLNTLVTCADCSRNTGAFQFLRSTPAARTCVLAALDVLTGGVQQKFAPGFAAGRSVAGTTTHHVQGLVPLAGVLFLRQGWVQELHASEGPLLGSADDVSGWKFYTG